MIPVKRNQTLPLDVDKSKGTRMLIADNGALMMLGYFFGKCFYTPDLGKDNWEVWDLSNVTLEVVDNVTSIVGETK